MNPTVPPTSAVAPAETLRLGGGQHDFGRWSSSEALGAANWTLAQLKKHGVEASGRNRLIASRDLLRQTNLIGVQYHFGSPTATAVSEAIKTTFEQYLIVRYLNHIDKPAAKKLRLMLSGDLLPATTGNDNGRDAQAELFAGVIFRAASYSVDLGEPDLLLTKGGRKWGVAVKRVKSDRQFRARVRKAQSQLEGQGLYGFIVVNPEILLDRMFAEGHSRDSASEGLYQKTIIWTRYIDTSKPDNRVLALMALATGFRPLQLGSEFRFEFGVYIQQQYVTQGTSKEIAAVKRIGDSMHRAINETLSASTRLPATSK